MAVSNTTRCSRLSLSTVAAFPGTPRKAAVNEHEYLRRFVDPVLMPLIESLLLYQPESIYEFVHDYVDKTKSAPAQSIPQLETRPPGVFSNAVDDRLEQGLHWLLEQVDTNYDALNDRVQADLAIKKAMDQQRRAEQRARVSAWREEREQREMVRHDKPSLVPHDESEVGPATSGEGVNQQQTGAESQKQEEQPEEAVIYCSNCTSQPAVTKCAATKWMPVCAAELKSTRSV